MPDGHVGKFVTKARADRTAYRVMFASDDMLDLYLDSHPKSKEENKAKYLKHESFLFTVIEDECYSQEEA